MPAKLSDRLRLLQWTVPLLIICLAVFHQLGPARWVNESLGEWAHYTLEILFYGTTGPLVIWFTLRTVRNWIEQKELAEAEVYRLNIELNHRIDERTRLLKQIIKVQEDENKRISRELHDDFAQTLTALTIHLEATLQSLPTDMVLLKEHLLRVQDLTNTMLSETHRWIQDLRPRVLDDLGLVPAIRWYVSSHLEPAGVETRLDISAFRWRLPPELETTLFRTIQEGLSNIAQHSQARHASVKLTSADSRIVAEVDDDGIGFDPQELQDVHEGTRGIGLLGMRERASIVGGQVIVDSRPGGGTRLRIEVPWMP
ncbi:MAG TPA: sensor histidine kinase [Anaerolineae bacterium]|jgi:signal transduction histidine kinase